MKSKSMKPATGTIMSSKETASSVEDRMVELIDEIEMFKALQPDLRRALLDKDIRSMLKGVSPWALARLVHIAQYAKSDTAAVSALKDILDRAGYKPVEKQAILNVNELTDGELDAKITGLLYDVFGKEATQTLKGTEGSPGREPGTEGESDSTDED